MPVDHQRVIIEQQRILIGADSVPIPRFEVEELSVLRVDLEIIVEWDVHRIGRSIPLVELTDVEPRRTLHVRKLSRGSTRQGTARFGPRSAG